MIKQKGKVLISACLTGVCCRYDGGHCRDGRLLAVWAESVLIPICPEQLGGLSTPRQPAEIIGGEGHNILSGQGAVHTQAGKDVTSLFINGAQKTLEIAKREGVERAVLKSNSPSCGCGSIYDGSFSGLLRAGDGVTTALLKKEGIICQSSQEIVIDPDSF
jgi:uncharacterized protein YbbK (DUF523 family)